MYNTGQSCCSVERIYVHAGIHDAFVAAFLATVHSFKVGDPAAEDTYIGAITRAPQLAVLEAQVADAVAKGATLHCGGHRLPGPGNWFAPTVLTGVDHTMTIMQEESFGPVIGIQKVGGDAEAVALMNDTRYGLTAGVFTPNEARARALQIGRSAPSSQLHFSASVRHPHLRHLPQIQLLRHTEHQHRPHHRPRHHEIEKISVAGFIPKPPEDLHRDARADILKRVDAP
jgi:acyl-CoA reductase-like NAD-dependent aldehyde dehydrogenase